MDNGFIDLLELSGVSNYFPEDIYAFTNCNMDALLQIPDSMPDIKQIIGVKSTINIVDKVILPFRESIKWDGNMAPGNTLLIKGEIKNTIEYISSLGEGKIAAVDFTNFFSSSITMDDSFGIYSKYDIMPYIEDIFVLKHDERRIYIDVMFVLTANTIWKTYNH